MHQTYIVVYESLSEIIKRKTKVQLIAQIRSLVMWLLKIWEYVNSPRPTRCDKLAARPNSL